MDVVLVSSNLFKVDVIACSNFLRNLCNSERNVVGKKGFAVLDRKDEVIVGVVRIVVSLANDHARILVGNRGFPNLPPRIPRQAAGKSAARIISPATAVIHG